MDLAFSAPSATTEVAVVCFPLPLASSFSIARRDEGAGASAPRAFRSPTTRFFVPREDVVVMVDFLVTRTGVDSVGSDA